MHLTLDCKRRLPSGSLQWFKFAAEHHKRNHGTLLFGGQIEIRQFRERREVVFSTERTMSLIINNKEISIAGRFFRVARLRHEWCDFLDDPPAAIQQMQNGRPIADLFTFV